MPPPPPNGGTRSPAALPPLVRKTSNDIAPTNTTKGGPSTGPSSDSHSPKTPVIDNRARVSSVEAGESPKSQDGDSPSKGNGKATASHAGGGESTWLKFLPSITTLELIVAYVQYIGLMLGVDVGWPSEYTSSATIVNFTVLDVRNKVVYLPPLDYRIYFLALATLLPLLLTFLMLVFFKSFDVVVWYFLVLSGIAAFAAGVSVKLLPGNVFTEDKPADVFFIAGIVTLSVCILLFLAKMLYKHIKRKQRQTKRLEEELSQTAAGGSGGGEPQPSSPRARDTLTPSVSHSRRNSLFPGASGSNLAGRHSRRGSVMLGARSSGHRDFVQESLDMHARTLAKYDPRPMWQLVLEAGVISLLIVIVVLCAFIFEVDDSEIVTVTGPVQTAGRVFGRTCAAFAFFITVHFLLLQFRKGRVFIVVVVDFVRANTVRVMILVLMVLYIPVTNTLLATGNCSDVTCPAGTRFPNKDVRLDSSAPQAFLAVDAADICGVCPFQNCNPVRTNALCPEITDSRLLVDPSLSCERHIFPYYTPASLLLIMGFTLGVPLLFYTLVRHATAALLEIDMFHCGADDVNIDVETQYARVTGITDNSAKTLYYAFEFSWRYFKIFLLLQRLVIVGVALYLTLHPKASIIAMTSVHFLFTAQSLWSRPYLSDNEDLLSSMMSLCLVFDGVVGTMLAYGLDPPLWLVYTLPVANIILPIGGTLVGSILISRRRRLLRQLASKHNALEEADQVGTDIRGKLLLHQLLALSEYRRKKADYERKVQRARIRGTGDTTAATSGKAGSSRLRSSSLFALPALNERASTSNNATTTTTTTTTTSTTTTGKASGNTPAPGRKRNMRRATVAVGRLPSSSEDESPSGKKKIGGNASSSSYYSSSNADEGGSALPKDTSSESYYSTSSDEELSKIAPGNKGGKGTGDGSSSDDNDKPLQAPVRPILLSEKAAQLRSNTSLKGGESNPGFAPIGIRDSPHSVAGSDAEEEDSLVKGVQRMDRLLNMYTAKAMANYFLILGVLAFLALSIILVGIVHGATTNNFVPQAPRRADDSAEYIRAHEFAQYNDWTEFTNNCCCETGGGTSKYPITEEWTCLNGFIKEKGRNAILRGTERTNYGGIANHDGLVLRGMCANTSNPGVCGPSFDPNRSPLKARFNFWTVRVCPVANSTGLVAGGNTTNMTSGALPSGDIPTEYAMERLW